MTDARTVPAEPGARTTRASSFRPDVEGLRAVAILAVVGYHAGLPFLPGGFVGVDVFFVISGFLITGLLASEVARTGTVSLRRFWARRARRLLPAATLVIAVTAVASWLMVPQVDHGSVGLDLVASALYVANIRFAFQATDYLTEDAAPSPALHFWSLGVEEQFYLVWPLLVLAVVWLLLRRRATSPGATSDREAGPLGGSRTVPALVLVLAVVGVLSFALSLRLTERVQPWAFFSMPTRAWEFAVGGLLALGIGAVARAPRLARHLVGWLGLLMLLGSVVLIDGDQPFPGTVAIWPVLGTAAVIAAGVRPSEEADRPLRGVPGLMALGPMRWVGRLSYSWYLWHWPVLVLAASALGELSLPVSLALALLSLVPAALAYRYVEQPVRLSAVLAADPGRSLRLGGALSATAAAFGLVLALLPGGGALATVAAPDAGGRGAAPLATGSPSPTPTPSTTPDGSPSSAPSPSATAITWPEGELTPDPSDARADLPVIYDDGCHLDAASTQPEPCVFGDASSDVTIVLFGDSHAAQWFPAVRKAAEDRGWRLVSWTKSGCPAPDVTIFQRRLQRAYDECDAWRSNVLDLLTSTQRPTLVLAAGTRTESLQDRASGERLEGTGRAGAEWQDGWRRTLERLTEAAVPVAVLRDTPWPGVDMAACVGQNRDDPSACDVTREALDATKYDVGLAQEFDLATAIDLSDILCDADRCPATRGRYLVYRDTDHLTATFARALSPYLADSLDAALAP